MSTMEMTTWEFLVVDKSGKATKSILGNFDKMDNRANKFEGNYGKVTGKVNKKTGKMKKNFSQLGNQFPIMGRAASLMTNPLVLAGAAIVGIGAMSAKAAKHASEFNNTFLELKNLNLSKTDAQIEQLRDSILDLSFEKGLDPQKTSKAFFDVQSATGKYGSEVEKIVGKVGVFARTMKADFNTSIDGASKAMGIFKFGANDLDKFLASNYKTVQVGITTFDQLASVQTEYAGAAAAAGQDFDEANKLFALFTKTSKSVDIAATMTKSAFNDLTKKSTIKGFESLGVNMFDASGNMRKMEDITKDLVPKLKTMSDQDFSKLKEDIGGSEGLRGLLDSLKNSGDDVLETFEAFNNVDFDFDKALKNANGDLQVMSEIVENKLSVAWIKFGDKILPILIKLKSMLADILDWTGDVLKQANDGIEKLMNPEEFRQNVQTQASAKQKEAYIGNVNDLFTQLAGGGKLSKDEFAAVYNKMSQTFQEDLQKKKTAYDLNKFLGSHSTRSLHEFTGETEEAKKFQALMKKNVKAFESGDFKTIISDLEAYSGLKFKDFVSKATQTTGTDAGTDSGSDSGKGDGLTEITGAASRVRNVTVNIQKLVEKFEVHATESGLGESEILDMITEVLVRAVNDAELLLSTD